MITDRRPSPPPSSPPLSLRAPFLLSSAEDNVDALQVNTEDKGRDDETVEKDNVPVAPTGLDNNPFPVGKEPKSF